MTGGAAQTRLRFWGVDLVSDGTIKLAVEEHSVVMTSRAPL